MQHSKIVGLRSRIWSNPVFALLGLVSAPRPAGARIEAHRGPLVRLSHAPGFLDHPGRDFRTSALRARLASSVRASPCNLVSRSRKLVSPAS